MLPLTLPSLVSLEWKLGVTIASSSSPSSPARPFVVLSFVIDDSGALRVAARQPVRVASDGRRWS